MESRSLCLSVRLSERRCHRQSVMQSFSQSNCRWIRRSIGSSDRRRNCSSICGNRGESAERPKIRNSIEVPKLAEPAQQGVARLRLPTQIALTVRPHPGRELRRRQRAGA
jgi:hypothetical protein